MKQNGTRVTTGTIDQYQYVLKLLEEFELQLKVPLRICMLPKQSALVTKQEKKYWAHFFKAFCDFLYNEKDCYDTYVNSVCKSLKAFFNYLAEDQNLPIGHFHKMFKVPHQLIRPVVLQPEMLQFLIKNEAFENSLSASLKRTKDLFVFGCTVALRYSDLIALKKTQLIQAPEGHYIYLHTKKTNTFLKLPLPSHLTVILSKYKTLRHYLLPRLSLTNFNLQVKELCKKAGWIYPLPKIRYKRGKPIEIKTETSKTLLFFHHVTTHTMRRTAITTLLTLGVPEYVVRRISGHSANSREFSRYVLIAQEHLNNQVLRAFDDLLNEPAS